jgi:hypothetical protein
VKRAVVAVVMVLAVGAAGAAAAPKPRPAGVDWGTGHFTASEALKTWLADRGVRYEDWLQRHPRGAYLMTHQAPIRRRSGGAGATRPSHTRASAKNSAAMIAIYGLAGVLLILAAIPGSLLVRIVPMQHHPKLIAARTTFGAAGLTLVVGAIVASHL